MPAYWLFEGEAIWETRKISLIFHDPFPQKLDIKPSHYFLIFLLETLRLYGQDWLSVPVYYSSSYSLYLMYHQDWPLIIKPLRKQWQTLGKYISFSTIVFIFYLFDRQKDRWSIFWLSLWQLGWGQIKPGIPELNLSFPLGWQGLNHISQHTCCLRGCALTGRWNWKCCWDPNPGTQEDVECFM